jgi:hypothetical protein
MRGTHNREQPEHVLHRQEVLNHHWPRDPQRYRYQEPGVPVRVRIVWERDGEEYVEGMARCWDSSHVYVEVRDVRNATNGVWVKPHDVYRRLPT